MVLQTVVSKSLINFVFQTKLEPPLGDQDWKEPETKEQNTEILTLWRGWSHRRPDNQEPGAHLSPKLGPKEPNDPCSRRRGL